MEKYRLLLIGLLLAAGLGRAGAQNSASPYSKIGYGLLSENATGLQRSMGGVGYAMQNGRQINVMNPASYASVDSLTFLWDIGIDLTNLWSKENGNSGHSFGGGLDYIAAEFKLAKRVGGSFGVVPFSSVGYSFGNTLENNGTETRSGNGGISELYAGVGWEPFNGMSAGANFSYMFGTIVNDTYVYSTSTTLFERVMEVRDWNVNLGLQYRLNLNRKDRLVVGFTYSPKRSLHGHTWGLSYDASQDTKVDSIGYTGLTGKYQKPNTFGVGLSYSHLDRFTAEVDFTYQDWGKAKYTPLEGFESSSMKFDNRWKVAAGLQYTPNSRGSYLKRVTYRMGGHYNHDYMNIGGNNVRDYGAGFGLTLPAPGSKTLVNLGFEWKHRFTTPKELIKEDYFNITLSVTFNEMWFWKNKIR